MGCHTWVYKRISALSEEEKTRIASEKDDFYINHWWAERKTVEELKEEVKKWFKEQPKIFNVKNCGTPREYAERIIREHEDSKKQYTEDPWKYFLKKHHDDYPVCFERGKETYVQIDCDSPFRVFDYPEEEFTDCENLISWLKKYKGDIEYYSETKNGIACGFCSELEQKIRGYFKLHGENNLLIDFG